MDHFSFPGRQAVQSEGDLGQVSLVWDARLLRRYRHNRDALVRECLLEGGLHGFLEEKLGRQG